MMRTSMDYQSRNIKHSEMKKPYLDDGSFQSMENMSDANPGMRPQWLDPPDWDMPDAPITNKDTRVIYQHVFLCSTMGCYCPGETTCINFSCMSLVPVRLDGVSGSGASGLKGKGQRIDEGAGQGQICLTTASGAQSTVELTVKGTAYDGVKLESTMAVEPCEFRAYSEKCAGCVCGAESIGYTTNQMSTGGTQNLTVTGAVAGCTYNWAITVGGGSLSSSTGTSVTYTAPASNANCANNPTITMSCGSTLKDTLKIAVDAGVAGDAYGSLGSCSADPSNPSYAIVPVQKWDCEGNVTVALHNCNPHVGIPACPAGCVTCAAGYSFPVGSTCPGTYDLRTVAMKAAGCCPAALL